MMHAPAIWTPRKSLILPPGGIQAPGRDRRPIPRRTSFTSPGQINPHRGFNYLLGDPGISDPLFSSVLWLHNVQSLNDAVYPTATHNSWTQSVNGSFTPVGSFVSNRFFNNSNILRNLPVPTVFTYEFFSTVPGDGATTVLLANDGTAYSIEITGTQFQITMAGNIRNTNHGATGLTHFAYVSNTSTMYVNGVSISSGSNFGIPTGTTSWTFGFGQAGILNVTPVTFGPVRITRGVRYASNFTPPAWGPFPTS